MKTMKHALLPTVALFTGLALFAAGTSFARVGINTSDPKATLDVKGSPADPGVIDGLIIPTLSAADLNVKPDYTAAQDGAMIYIPFVSPVPVDPKAQIANVQLGLNIFDGENLIWRPVGFADSNNITKTLKLPAEYTGAVVVSAGAGIGNLSGDYNGTENVYRWETTEATDQTVYISVQISLPNDFKFWESSAGTNLTLSGTNAVIHAVENAAAAGVGTANVTLDGSHSPGDIIRVVIRLTANAGFAEAGLLTLSYK